MAMPRIEKPFELPATGANIIPSQRREDLLTPASVASERANSC